MNKRQLVREVSEATGSGLFEATRSVDTMLAIFDRALRRGERIQLAGFGIIRSAEPGSATWTLAATVPAPASLKPIREADALRRMKAAGIVAVDAGPRGVRTVGGSKRTQGSALRSPRK